MKTNLYFTLGFLISSCSAFAFNDSYNGNLVLCPNQAPVVLDYFDTALPVLDPSGPNVVDLSKMSEQDVVAFALKRLEGTTFQAKLSAMLLQDGPVENWISTDLKDTSDKWENYDLTGDCKRVQGSARISNALYIDPIYARNLSPAQLGVLQLHEAIVSLDETKDYYRNSSDERELVRRILNLDYGTADLAESIRNLGFSEVYPYETVLKSGYVGNDLMNLSPEDSSDGRRRCGLKFNQNGNDPSFTLQYSSFGATAGIPDDWSYCNSTDRPQLLCSLDGTQCTVIDGGMESGWQVGCTAKISFTSNQHQDWTFSCPGTSKTWVFQLNG